MKKNDTVRRFVFDNQDVRGCLVSLHETCVSIQQTHYYPPNLAKLLNEFAVAAVLLHDSIKIDGSITIQLRQSGSQSSRGISLLMADCMPDRNVRAIAEYESELLSASDALNLNDFASDSVLSITITPDVGERYQSIVPLESDSLSECLEDYFARSEQLPTWFKLIAEKEQAIGIALHALPSAQSELASNREDIFSRLRILLNTLTEKEALELDGVEILTRLFHEESCRLFEPQPVKFGCICSAQKSLDAIKSLGEKDVKALLAEQQREGHENVFVDCHFCFQRYEFSFQQVEELFV